MATSSYPSTEETTNTNRACRLLLGPCTDELRDVLRHHVPPPTFPQVIVQRCINLPRLTVPQRNLILPRNNSYTGNYNDMDISLLCILLRNICSIPPHSKGWGNDPDPTDRSLSANIERLRIARNQCVHSSSPSLSNADFNTIWSTVRSAVMDLDSFLNNGNQYEREVDFLRYETMDPLRDRHYVEELRKQAEEDAATREIVHGIKSKVEEIETGQIENKNKILEIDGKVEEIETGQIENKNKMLEIDGKVEEIETDQIENKNKMLEIDDILSKLQDAVIPPNVKAICKNDVLQWEEDDKVFCESHNFPAMLEKVKKEPHVTFVGVPGSGKTATAHHIALMLQQEKYEIVPIKDIRKIEDYCDPKNPQAFVIDDVVGVFGLQETKLNLLSDYKERIMKPIMPKSKTLMTCREAVYRKTIEESSSFFADKNNIILLHSGDNALTNSDKTSLLKMYNVDGNLFSPASLTSASKMFPYLCKLFSTEKKFQLYGSVYFENPIPCILKELEEMRKQNKIHYVSLVLCMMNENKISEKLLEETEKEMVIKNFREMKHSILRKCKVSSQTDNFNFVDALSEMEGTYTELCGTEYSFVHDSMFEIVAYHFGVRFPELILQFMSSNYVANYVKLQKCKIQDLEIEIKQASENVAHGGENKQEEENAAVSGESKKMELFDLCIRLREDQYSMLAERLYRDVENMELYDVFMNNVLKQPKLCQVFIEVLKRKSYMEWQSLFLSEQKDVSKVVSKGKRMERESEKKGKGISDRYRQMVLLNERGISELRLTYSVRVISWVVYYGHNQILQYVLEQTDLHKETQSKLFWNSFIPVFSYATKQGKMIIETNNTTKKLCSLNSWRDSGNQKKDTNPSITEQHRLLMLSCYGGDLETFRILIKYVNINTINKSLQYLGYDYVGDDTPFTAACKGGHKSVVKELLKAGADVNPKGKYNSPLTAACVGGHMSVVSDLLEAGADVNVQGKYNTPLVAACERGHTNLVKDLLKAEADVNQKGEHYPPLTCACEGGYLSIVKQLLEAGADINPQGYYNSPLIAACKRGHTNVVKELLKAFANINPQDKYNTPLTAACDGGHLNIVKELLEAGADVRLQGRYNTPLTAACQGGSICIVKELLDAGADVNEQGQYDTPLTAACGGGHISVVKALLKARADVNVQGICNTPLIEACKKGHESIVKELLKAGADANLHCENNTPLTAACKDGHMNIVKELLQAGADVNPQEADKTPLTAACEGRHVSVVRELLKAGADVNPQCKYDTPLIEACKAGEMSVVKGLLEAGADVNLQGKYDTPLTSACKNGHMNVAKELLEAGADVNLHDWKGETPIYIAVLHDFENLIPTVLMLSKYGADPSICDEEGLSPLCIALYKNKPDVVKLLLQNETQSNNLRLHLFDCLVNIRHSYVMTNSKDDVVVQQKQVWHMKKLGVLYKTILQSDCNVLKGLLVFGLDVNQWIQLHSNYDNECVVRSILCTLIEDQFILIKDGAEKVRILLEAGVDINVRVRYREYDSMLDREGVSVLERTRRLMSEIRKSKTFSDIRKVPEYRRVLSKIKKHVRRYSV